MTLTRKKRDAMRARCVAATPGPWRIVRNETDPPDDVRVHGIIAITKDGERDVVKTDSGIYPPYEADAQFIAFARDDVPRLLDALDAYEAECDRLRRLVAYADHRYHCEISNGRMSCTCGYERARKDTPDAA